MSVQGRHRIECRIVRSAVGGLIDAGYSLSLLDGDHLDMLPTDKAQAQAIVGTWGAANEDRLLVFPAEGGECVGWVHFTYGKHGWDVIADYTPNLEDALTDANELADELECRYG
ncbi:hypothetical protein [Stenotrophomonas acidaminiphila]|uniref:hypothetical protein n=1 Tax=Stenotrophomonas acidaminiphila TaxID=128780 RepID=UPI0015F7EA74|nr:hypothetical protein [Stenotrophomonas acidaminiphila]